MEISAASSSLNTLNSRASRAPGEMHGARPEKQVSDPHHHGHRYQERAGRALDVFRQELQFTLKAHFQAKFATRHPGYAQMQEPATSGDVASEALGAARQVVAESPTKAANSLITFKSKVQETANFVRQTFDDGRGEMDDVEQTLARVDQGINKLEGEVSNNRESSASVLAVDNSSKQKSTISIRTQDGDIVRLTLKNVEQLSATRMQVSNNNGTATSTEIEVSSRSRMKLQVEGDLNEVELEAIRNVFAQAEKMADDFFGGDMGAAFKLAEGFEFDTEQLMRVNMRFKMQEATNISYTESAGATQFSAASPAAMMEPSKTVAAAETAPRAAAEPTVIGDAPVVAAAAEPVLAPVEAPVELAETAGPDTSITDNSTALSKLFETLSTFLRSIGEGFESGSASGSFKYHYSESFKFDLLKAVIHTLQPEGT